MWGSKGYSKLRAVYFAHINSGQMEYVTNLDSTEIRGPISLPKCDLFGGFTSCEVAIAWPGLLGWMSQQISKKIGSVGYNLNIPYPIYK